MKNINFPMLLLAILVILLFSAVGVAIALRHLPTIIALLMIGFIVMGYGIYLKKNEERKVT